MLPVPELRNVVTSPLQPGASEAEITHILQELVKQLHTKERRCVLVLDDRDAVVREVALPPMSRTERLSAARLEAERFAPSTQACTVNVARTSAHLFALSSVTTAAVERLIRIARAAKLRVVAIDHAAFALSRAYVHCDAVIDIGLQQTRFYACKAAVPFSHVLDVGGESFTRALARSFSIDEESAEGRKRMHGIAPAGEAETSAIVHFTGRAMRAARAAGVTDIERIILTGNGARLPSLPARLERDTGCLVEIASRLPGCITAFPDDIVRAAVPDWGLACGAALWSLAEEFVS